MNFGSGPEKSWNQQHVVTCVVVIVEGCGFWDNMFMCNDSIGIQLHHYGNYCLQVHPSKNHNPALLWMFVHKSNHWFSKVTLSIAWESIILWAVILYNIIVQPFSSDVMSVGGKVFNDILLITGINM